jgi:hypothetical protein
MVSDRHQPMIACSLRGGIGGTRQRAGGVPEQRGPAPHGPELSGSIDDVIATLTSR